MEWIAVDWGTTRLRAWRMLEGKPLAEAESDAGMAGLAHNAFEPALLSLIAPWLEGKSAPVPVIAAGMVGARQGWVEAPYIAAPCAPLAKDMMLAPTRDPRIIVRIIPGVSQSSPPDVMRGEETQIAGLLVREPRFDGVVCLPGTHSKWARVADGKIVAFRSFMTGEMFALLAARSVLRHSVGAEEMPQASPQAEKAFADAVTEMQEDPASLSSRLFAIRAAALVSGDDPLSARARLSGLLIGAELISARGWWKTREVALIGDAGLCARYAQALEVAGGRSRLCDAAAMTVRGLAAAYGKHGDAA